MYELWKRSCQKCNITINKQLIIYHFIMRKVTVLVQSTGKKSVVEGEIKTLADLKHYLDVNGVSYPSECEFKEGKTKTIFVDNDAVLPTNVEWKGEVSDDLIMYVSAPKKKIKSGAMDRKEAYEYIKKNNLQDVVKTKYGRNYTQVPTNDLIKVIEDSMKKNEVGKYCDSPSNDVSEKVDSNVNSEMIDKIKEVIEELHEDDEITDYAYNTLIEYLGPVKTSKKKKTVEDMSFSELVSEFDFN